MIVEVVVVMSPFPGTIGLHTEVLLDLHIRHHVSWLVVR
jgi:hypothetical protein